MNLATIKDTLLRRLSVNYVSHLGGSFKEGGQTEDWCEGYFQAKKDVELMLKQMEMFNRD